MARKLLINIGSGYFFKIIQITSGLITVPILVSSNGLGLSGYGQLMAALSWSSLLSMALDGFRLVAAKQMGANKNNLLDEFIKCNIVFSITLLIVCIPIVFIFDYINPYLGIYQDNNFFIGLLIYFISEQFLYINEQYFHSKSKTFLVNAFNSVESLVRILLILWIFGASEGSQTSYIQIFIFTYLLKIIGYLTAIRRSTSNSQATTFNINYLKHFIIESMPLTFKGVVSFFVFRSTIIYANNFLSSELAAIFSIIFFTVRSYLAQVFVNVIRPMIIPKIASMSFGNTITDEAIKINTLVTLFELSTLLTISLIASLTPFWLTLWLGPKFGYYQNIFSFSIWILAIESAFSIKTLCLIAQSYGRSLSYGSILTCVCFFLGFGTLFYLQKINFEVLTLLILVYIVVYNGFLVNYLFNNKILRKKYSQLSLIAYILFSIPSYFCVESNQNCFNIPITAIWVLLAVILYAFNDKDIKKSMFILKSFLR